MGDFGQHLRTNDFVPGILQTLRQRGPQTEAELVGNQGFEPLWKSAVAFCVATDRIRQRPDGKYELVPTAPNLVDVFDLPDPGYLDLHG